MKRRLRELIEYIKWKQGWQTMEAYEHYFDATRHAEIQDTIYQRMDEVLMQGLEKRKQNKPKTQQEKASPEVPPNFSTHHFSSDPDFEFLRSIGGSTGGH